MLRSSTGPLVIIMIIGSWLVWGDARMSHWPKLDRTQDPVWNSPSELAGQVLGRYTPLLTFTSLFPEQVALLHHTTFELLGFSKKEYPMWQLKGDHCMDWHFESSFHISNSSPRYLLVAQQTWSSLWGSQSQPPRRDINHAGMRLQPVGFGLTVAIILWSSRALATVIEEIENSMMHCNASVQLFDTCQQQYTRIIYCSQQSFQTV